MTMLHIRHQHMRTCKCYKRDDHNGISVRALSVIFAAILLVCIARLMNKMDMNIFNYCLYRRNVRLVLAVLIASFIFDHVR